MIDNVLTRLPIETGDDLDVYAQQLRNNLPGLEMVLNADSSVGRENELLVPRHIIEHAQRFTDFVFDEIRNLVLDGKNVKVCIPLHGGLMSYYELIRRVALDPSLLTRSNAIEFVFAAKNGTGKDCYTLTQIEGQTDIFYLIDDIFDKGGSSENILSQAPQNAQTRSEFFSTKFGRAHSQNAPIHVLPDEWIKTCYGMNGGLGIGDPELELQIEIAERECALPLMQIDQDQIRAWPPEKIELYLDILKRFTHFDRESADFKNFDFILRAVQNAKGFEAKFEVIQRLNKIILKLIIDGSHLDKVTLAEIEG